MELIGRKPQIEEDSIDGGKAELLENRSKCIIGLMK
jgi:hypothetical protein